MKAEKYELQGALKGKIQNALLLLNDADTFLWFRREGHLAQHPELGGGNWLILLGVLSVLNLLGKISFLGDSRLRKCESSWFISSHPKTACLGSVGVSEKNGFINLYKIAGNWGIDEGSVGQFWEDNRHHLAHLGFPKYGGGVVDGENLGNYVSTKVKITAGEVGPIFFKLPLENSPYYGNADLLCESARKLVQPLISKIDKASYQDLQKIYDWC